MRYVLISIVIVTIFATGCASAKVVHRDRHGGTLALHGPERKAYEKAHEQMAYHCNGPYEIVEEGEVVVGSETVHVDETYEEDDGTIVQEGGTQTRDVTEWRVTYECIDDEATAAPASDGGDGYGDKRGGDEYDDDYDDYADDDYGDY